MSTATACLLATSTVFLEDVYLKLRGFSGTGSVAQSRSLTLVLGALAAAVACLMHDVIAALTVGYDLLVGAVFVPIIMAIFANRGSPMAALAAITASAVVVIVLILVYGIDSTVPIYGGLAVSAVIVLLGTVYAARSPPEQAGPSPSPHH
jgi:SSS family solute:Na+ symporter